MKSITAALLGLSHPHSLAHLRTLQAIGEVDTILLWDNDEEILNRTRRQNGMKVEATFTDLDALLAREDVFFAITAVRTDLGPDIFARVLEAGKHLLAEKPMGKTALDAERIISIAERSGCTLGICYQNRANPAVLESRRLVADGLLGPLVSVEMRMLTTQVRFRDPRHWLFRKSEAGGGILSWLGCHYIDMMRYITGDEIVSVRAETATRSDEEIDVEDVAILSLRFRSGAIGSLHTGYVLTLSGEGYHNKKGYDTYVGVNGRKGRLSWSSDGRPDSLYAESVNPAWASAPRRTMLYELADSDAYLGVYGEDFVREFIRAAHEGRSAWATGADALQVARVVDAAYLSSKSGRRVIIAE